MLHPLVRPAGLADLNALAALEQRVFPGDRLSRRSLRRFLAAGAGGSSLLVAELDGRLAGYALVLFRAGAARARLYSIAVAPEHAKRGVGRVLLAAAEAAAARRGCLALGLETRADNPAAVALWDAAGYRRFGRRARYYEDGMDALRFEKPLAPDGVPAPGRRSAVDRSSPMDEERGG